MLNGFWLPLQKSFWRMIFMQNDIRHRSSMEIQSIVKFQITVNFKLPWYQLSKLCFVHCWWKGASLHIRSPSRKLIYALVNRIVKTDVTALVDWNFESLDRVTKIKKNRHAVALGAFDFTHAFRNVFFNGTRSWIILEITFDCLPPEWLLVRGDFPNGKPFCSWPVYQKTVFSFWVTRGVLTLKSSSSLYCQVFYTRNMK